MTEQLARTTGGEAIGRWLSRACEDQGSASHPYVASAELNSDRLAARNLADAAHFLCMLHGQMPGVVDLAADRTAEPAARQWLAEAIDGVAHERLFLTNLTVAAGPLPSTPGHGESESAVLAQRHAIETLARSERAGCALGAAMALVLDWRAIRAVLNAAAEKLSVDAPRSPLPDAAETETLAEALAGDAAIARALRFGAEQVLAQHRGLWTLLEARQAVREDW